MSLFERDLLVNKFSAIGEASLGLRLNWKIKNMLHTQATVVDRTNIPHSVLPPGSTSAHCQVTCLSVLETYVSASLAWSWFVMIWHWDTICLWDDWECDVFWDSVEAFRMSGSLCPLQQEHRMPQVLLFLQLGSQDRKVGPEGPRGPEVPQSSCKGNKKWMLIFVCQYIGMFVTAV